MNGLNRRNSDERFENVGRRGKNFPIPNWTEIETGFMAGWLEGEGTFLINRQKQLQLSIQELSTDQDTIEKVCWLLNANVRHATKNRNHKSLWRFSLSGPRALEVMLRIYPLMSDRRKFRICEVLTAW